MPPSKDYSDRERACILLVMMKGRGDISPADAQKLRCYIFITLFIFSDL